MKYALLPLTAFAAICTVVVAEGVPSFTVSFLSLFSRLHSTRFLIFQLSRQPTAVDGIFVEQFTEGWEDRWSPSKATKEEKQGEVSTSFFEKVSSTFDPTCLPQIRLKLT